MASWYATQLANTISNTTYDSVKTNIEHYLAESAADPNTADKMTPAEITLVNRIKADLATLRSWKTVSFP